MSQRSDSPYPEDADSDPQSENFELDYQLFQGVMNGDIAINDYFNLRPAGTPEHSTDGSDMEVEPETRDMNLPFPFTTGPNRLNQSMVQNLNRHMQIHIRYKMHITFNAEIPRNDIFGYDQDTEDEFLMDDDEDEVVSDMSGTPTHVWWSDSPSSGASDLLDQSQDDIDPDDLPFQVRLVSPEWEEDPDDTEDPAPEMGSHETSIPNNINNNLAQPGAPASDGDERVNIFHGVFETPSPFFMGDDPDTEPGSDGSNPWIDLYTDEEIDEIDEGDSDEELDEIGRQFEKGATSTKHPDRPFFNQSYDPEAENANLPRIYALPSDSNHFQCANAITVVNKSKFLTETIITVCKKFIFMNDISFQNLVPQIASQVTTADVKIQLPYRPYCVTVGHGYLACSGERGVSVIHLKSLRPVLVRDYKNIRQVHMINSIDIRKVKGAHFAKAYPHPKSLRNNPDAPAVNPNPSDEMTDLLVCWADNEGAIEVWGIFTTDVPEQTSTDPIYLDHDLVNDNLSDKSSIFHTHPRKFLVPVAYFDRLNGVDFPVNCAKFSPDGHWIAAVGDGPQLCLIPVRPSSFGEIVNLTVPIPVNEEHENNTSSSFTSQYIDWNSNGKLLAFTSDSHPYVWVWDIQTQKVVFTIPTSHHTFSIAFHPTQPDLLAFSHRNTYFHVVKLQANGLEVNKSTYLHTLHKLPLADSIEGLAWSTHGRALYVSTRVGQFIYDAAQVPSLTEICVGTLKREWKETNVDDQLISVLPKHLKTYFD